jgi:hypothetical protein
VLVIVFADIFTLTNYSGHQLPTTTTLSGLFFAPGIFDSNTNQIMQRHNIPGIAPRTF